MKGKCYYCNKELTQKTIKRHMKNCSEMKKKIEELSATDKKQRNQFIISIKPRYVEDEYCIYLSIAGTLGLVHIDDFIRDIWVECCGHFSAFNIRGKFYQDHSMNTKLNDILNTNEKFQYEYDFGSTTYLTLEVVDIIQVPNSFSQIEIIARNHEITHECKICGAEANYFNYEKDDWECENCVDEDGDMISKFDYCNSPRDGVCCYESYEEAEEEYLPGNNNKYKLFKSKRKERDEYKTGWNFEGFLEEEDLLEMEYAFDDLLNKSIINNVFNKGIYSFDIKELISNLSKDNIYDIARYLGMEKISRLNKSKLVEKLINQYEELIQERMYLFDEERYKFLKKYADNNGVKLFKEIDKKTLYKVGYFLQSGMLFSAVKDDESVILMPEIVQKLVREKNNIQYRSMIKHNSEIVNLYRGMNKAYGLLKLKDIKELFKRYSPYKESAEHIKNNALYESYEYRIEAIITNAEYYYREYKIEGIFFINSYIDTWKNLLEDIEEQINLDYAMIPKEELLSMSDENYIYSSKAGETFFREFISMFNMDTEILEGLMESLYLEIQESDLENVINEILEQLEDNSADIKEFMSSSLEKFLTSIRLWIFKGATLNEKKTDIIKNEKPTRRNDPCLCGSGNKYKDCCAKDGKVIKLF